MQAILHDRLPIAKIVNATIISLDQAVEGYKDFDKGAAKKFGKRQTKRMDEVFAAQAEGVRSAMR
jgi:hypothetical protein